MKPASSLNASGRALRLRNQRQILIDLDRARGKNPLPGTPAHDRLLKLESMAKTLRLQEA